MSVRVTVQDDKNGVFENPDFVSSVARLASDTKASWNSLLTAAHGGGSAKGDPLRQWLDDVRNRATYHFADRKGLLKCYHSLFLGAGKNEYTRAGLPYGTTLEETRFYYADAAVGAYTHTSDQKLATQVNDHFQSVARLLGGLIKAYSMVRESTAPGKSPS
jgi:hypothetical protein